MARAGAISTPLWVTWRWHVSLPRRIQTPVTNGLQSTVWQGAF